MKRLQNCGNNITVKDWTTATLCWLDYLSQLWLHYNESRMRQLQHVLSWFYARTTTSAKHFDWLPVEFRIESKLCLLIHVVHIGHCPSYLSDFVRLGPTGTAMTVLAFARYQVHQTTTPYMARRACFSFSGPLSWNNLPNELHNITDVHTTGIY